MSPNQRDRGLSAIVGRGRHGRQAGRLYRAARAGELRESTLDASWFRSRGWAPKWDLRDGLRQTFEYIEQSANGGTGVGE